MSLTHYATYQESPGTVNLTGSIPQMKDDYNLRSFKDFLKLYPNSHPGSEIALRKLYQKRFENGYMHAFLQVGPRKILVCPASLYSCQRDMNAQFLDKHLRKLNAHTTH